MKERHARIDGHDSDCGTAQVTNDEVLHVVVSCPCGSCDEALRLVELLAGARPLARVQVVDTRHSVAVAQQIVGSPAYLLGGRTVSLGNPSLDELIALVDNNGTHG